MIEGSFIVIEGIDGAGTTTQAVLLAKWFHNRGLPALTTHEPTDHTTPITFLAIGDTNPALGHTQGVLEHTLTRSPEFTVHLGDMQYYSSIIESWQLWFSMMQPLLSQGAILPCIVS